MKHPNYHVKYLPTNYLTQCKNPNFLEIWVRGKRYIADWHKVNEALLDSGAKAQLRKVPWSRVQLRDAFAVREDSTPAVLESLEVDERTADILRVAGEEAQRRIKEKFPDK